MFSVSVRSSASSRQFKGYKVVVLNATETIKNKYLALWKISNQSFFAGVTSCLQLVTLSNIKFLLVFCYSLLLNTKKAWEYNKKSAFFRHCLMQNLCQSDKIILYKLASYVSIWILYTVKNKLWSAFMIRNSNRLYDISRQELNDKCAMH